MIYQTHWFLADQGLIFAQLKVSARYLYHKVIHNYLFLIVAIRFLANQVW